jgi:GTPase
LIGGTSEGAGLGHDFLAHVGRTRLLVHVLDLAPIGGSDPVEDHATIEHELAAHDARLASLPRILALSKVDLVTPEAAAEAAAAWHERLGEEVPVLLTSSATGAGLDALRGALLEHVPLVTPVEVPEVEGLAEHQVFRPAATRGFQVELVEDGRFRVVGEGVDRLVLRYDVDNEEAMAHLERRLKRIGVIQALEDAGFEPGDDVEIGGVEFELDPS